MAVKKALIIPVIVAAIVVLFASQVVQAKTYKMTLGDTQGSTINGGEIVRRVAVEKCKS